MNPALALTLTLTFAGADFQSAKEAATEIDSLKKVVTTLVGLCDVGDEYEQRDCRRGLAAQASELRKKGDFYVYLGPQERGLRLEGARGGKVRVLWTPVVDAGNGLAMTLVKPRRLSKAGNVIVPTRPLDVELAPGILDSEIERGLRTGQVTVEMVGGFGPTWSLGRGSKKVQGVVFQPKVIRLSHARTGKALGEVSLR